MRKRTPDSAPAEDGAVPATTPDIGTSVPDQTTVEVEALLCALRAAPGVWLGQKTLQRLLTDTSRYVDTYSRALHRIERRTVHAHFAPGPARRAGPVRPPPDPARLDPWSCDPRAIEDASRVVSVCPTCGGAETVACGRCSGSARVSCGSCWGTGRVQGKRGTKNCGDCRGRGTQPCGACTNGRVPCDACGATGRVLAWLSISQERSSQVRAHPMGAAAHVHERLKSPADFDADPKTWANVLTADTGERAPSDELPPELSAELDPVRDRTLATRVQSFSSVVHRFAYEAVGMAGYIEVAGSPPAVSRSSNWRPLRVRQLAAAATAATLGMGALMLAGSYTARHGWYAAYGHGGWVALSGLSLAALLAATLAGILLPRRLWSSAGVKVPLGFAAVAALGLVLAWRYPSPTVSGARRAFEKGDFERADVEAGALRDLGLDPQGAAEVLDDLHLERLKRSTTFEDLASAVGEPWNLEERRQVGLRALHEIGEQKAGELYAARNAAGLASLGRSAGDLDPALRESVAAHGHLLLAEQCVAQRDCACVVGHLDALRAAGAAQAEAARVHDQAVPALAAAIRELVTPAAPAPARDPHERQKSLRHALDLARCYPGLAGGPSDPAPSSIEAWLAPVNAEVEAADRKAALLAALEEAKRKQQEAVAEAKRAQEQAAAAAREAAEERARRAASRSLLCRDGSTSGCSCAGSHRGCCSHHGGVAGCEPL